jgi:hypothetical protein
MRRFGVGRDDAFNWADPSRFHWQHGLNQQPQSERLIPEYSPDSPYANQNPDIMAIVDEQNRRVW